MKPFNSLVPEYKYAEQMTAGGFQIDGRPALTNIDPDMIGRYVIMVVRDPLLVYGGDPAEVLSKRLENPVLAGKSGMFTTYTGTYKGAPISIVSGGSGGPEAELVLVEFMHYTKADAFIRLGGGAALGENVKSGDVIIATGCVRDEGLTKAYVTETYPSVAHHELVNAFAAAAQELDVPHHLGIGRSVDSEHVSCGRPSVNEYFQREHLDIIDYYNRAGVLYWDRESSAIITLSSLFRRRGGAVVSVDNNLVTGEKFTAGHGQDNAIDIALEGYAKLYEHDQKQQR